MVPGLKSTAYRVDRRNWQLFSGQSAATLNLAGGDGLPSVSFRCAVTLSIATGHTDVSGTITIGSETLTFTSATRKTTIVLLTELPTITTSNLDCNILIEAINAAGAPIIIETATLIKTRFMDSQKAFMNAQGTWQQSQAIADVVDTMADVGKIFSYNGYDYMISQVSSFRNLGKETYRRLFLTGKTESPDDRTVMAEESDMALVELMRKSVYDADNDGIVDEAESIPSVDDLPENPSSGSMAEKGGKLYVAVNDS